MSLMSLPDELLSIILRHIVTYPGPKGQAKDYRNLAATCKHLAKLASTVLRDLVAQRDFDLKYLLAGDCRFFDEDDGDDEDDDGDDGDDEDDEDDGDEKLVLVSRWGKGPKVYPNPCPLHIFGQTSCYYGGLEALIKSKFYYYPEINLHNVNFRRSMCIFAAEGIRWHRLTTLGLAFNIIDLEIFAKLLGKMTHLTDLRVQHTKVELPETPFQGPPLIRKSLRDLTYDSSAEKIFAGQYLNLSARRVKIFKSYGDGMSFAYLTCHKDSIEFIDIYDDEDYEKIDYGSLFRELGLDKIKCQVHVGEEIYGNCLKSYSHVTNEFTYQPCDGYQKINVFK